MDMMLKPIAQYTEEIISNTWPCFVQDSLAHLYNELDQFDSEGLLAGEFCYLMETIYREGFKDGTALYTWLENGPVENV